MYSNRHARRRAAAIARVQQKSTKNTERRLSKTLFNTFAASSVGLAGMAAQPAFTQSAMPNDACTISGNIATCSGNQANGIASGVDFNAPPVDTLEISELTSDIESSGNDGVNFRVKSGDVTINSDTGTYSILTNGGDGINASTGTGNVSITSTGDIGLSVDEDTGSDGGGVYIITFPTGIVPAAPVGAGVETGIDTYVYGDGNITISSDGNITSNDDGISAEINGSGDIEITANGSITSSTEEGIDAEVNNDGNITITNLAEINSEDEAIDVSIRGSGNITITNSGEIDSDDSDGIDAFIEVSGDILIDNSGAVDADSDGIQAQIGNGYDYVPWPYFSPTPTGGVTGNITITNSAEINSDDNAIEAILNGNSGGASGFTSGYGAIEGDIIITNSGEIDSDDDRGIYARIGNYSSTSAGDITITNSGEIDAEETAIETRIYGTGNITIDNSVSLFSDDDDGISARSYNYGSGETGDIAITNSGSIEANGTAIEAIINSNDKSSSGYGAISGDIIITNSGLLEATDNAINARSRGGDITIINSADDAEESNYGILFGVNPTILTYRGAGIAASASEYGDVSVTNSAEILSTSTGISTYAEYGATTIENTGDINVINLSQGLLEDYYVSSTPSKSFIGSNSSFGIIARSDEGNINIVNSGNIRMLRASRYDSYDYDFALLNQSTAMISSGPEANETSFGINAQSYIGNINITNSGNIGIVNLGEIGYIPASAANKGPSPIPTANGAGVGINAQTVNSDITIENSGDIAIINVRNYGIFGTLKVSTENMGPEPIPSFGGNGVGINALANNGDVLVANSGDITIGNIINYGGYIGAGVSPANEGAPTLPGGVSGTSGINARTNNGDISIANSGDIDVSGIIRDVYDLGEEIFGTISPAAKPKIPFASSSGNAINANAYDGDIAILNTGDLTIGSGPTGIIGLGFSGGPAAASGINAYTRYGDITIANAGDITQSYGFPTFGIPTYVTPDNGISVGRGAGINARVYEGNITIANTGNIDLSGGFTLPVPSDAPTEMILAGSFGNSGINAEVFSSGYLSGPDTTLAPLSSGSIEIINTGSITGQNNGITIGNRSGNNAPATITNSGSIGALNGVAIDFRGEANDTLNLLSGAEFNGTVDFGTNNDSGNDFDTLIIGPGVNAEIEFADNSGSDSDAESAPEEIIGGATIVSLNDDGTSIAIVDPTTAGAQGTSTNDVSKSIFKAITRNFGGADTAQVTRLGFFPDTTATPEKRAWGSFFGGRSTFDGNASLASYENRHGGFIAGIEHGSIDTGGAIGFFGGYAQNNLEIAGGTTETDTNSLFGGVYLKKGLGVFDVNAALTFGVSDSKSQRTVGGSTALGDFSGYFISPAVEVSTPISALKSLPLIASLGVNYTGVFLDGYTETGTGAPLTVGDNDQHFLGVRAELTAPFKFVNDDGAAISFDVRTGVDSEFNIGSGDVSASVSNTPFTISAQGDDKVSGFLGFDLKYESLSGFSTVRFSAEAQSDFQENFEAVGEVRVTFKF